MDIDDLKIVAAVARLGSMNRAAAELHMVQSSITARIRLLEDELGIPLFVRHSRGVRLSDAGTRLLSFSGRIQILFNEAVASIKEDGIPKGSLRIGSTEPTVSLRLPEILAEYVRRYPAVALTITTGNTSDLLEQVLDQSLDGAFVAGPVNLPDLTEETIFREELVLVSPASTQSIEELRRTAEVKAIVLAHGCSFRSTLSEILEEQGIVHQVLPLASFDAIRSCVQSGLGVTLVPRDFFARVWKDSSVIAHELPEQVSQAKTVFVRRTDRANLSSLNAFLALGRAASNLVA
ncbi:MAG TPA: LysR family transcriptional regulator [Edaphobacter sp.]|jgi:DNA-binding transcriptional LysR family regulator